ncbi:hypothetical protein A2Z23_02765 [Candidatus Curtissbacteria bacterium RBG_16_39_7]|uniref:DUF4352 domain-containing protein n=1 Tax=Candidatus Curtissbacteria bacterium RBG_16_39_7 TaxID=1797707 RepID=A0A1F5G4L3_9BACT|nr:MAG: hypothetical protein A2Z23_02765 [Candidatus Curtissbacteria bacterium RBG_16_39_7]
MELSRFNVSTLAFADIFKRFFPGQKKESDQAHNQNHDQNIETPQPFKKIKERFAAWNKKTVLKLSFAAFVILAVAFLLLRAGGRSSETFTGSNVSPQKSIILSKTFQLAGNTENDSPTENFMNLTLTNAETTKQILIQGKPATAKGGKIFLIINLEIDNPHNQKLYISPVDLMRLVGPDDKKFAPDVHNNQVAIEPISIKKTRVGFVINEGTDDWKLQVGEVAGAKEIIDLPI